MATLDNDDLKAIKSLIEVTIDEAIDRNKFVAKSDLSHLPTKDDFYGKMDEVVGEQKNREEQALQSQHLSEYEDRIEKIEDHLGGSLN